MSTAFQTDAFQSDAWQIAAGTGEVPVEVPDVVGQAQADGVSALEAEGFSVSITEFYSSEPAGQIFAQSPVGGSLALPGATVSIYVSRGPEPSSAVGGWPTPPRRKKRKLDEPLEVQEQPTEAPTAIAVALERALTKTKVGDRVAEKAAREFAASLVASRQAQELQAAIREQELRDAIERRRRDEEETALLLILTARKRRSRQPA